MDGNAKRRQRIIDGIEDRGRRADRAALTETFGTGHRGCRRAFDVVKRDRGNLARGRRQIIGQRCGVDVPKRVVHDLFEQRIADALGNAAMHLAVGDQRIDNAAGVLDREEFIDANCSGLDVDFDDRNVTGVGECARRIVMRGLG